MYLREWARDIFIFQWNNKKVKTKFSSQVCVEAYSHFTESCACKCEEKFWPSFYFNTFSSFYLCPLWKLYFFSELISYFFSLIIEMTMTAIVVGIPLLLSPVSPPKVRHKIWECPTRLIPSWQSLELKPSQRGLAVCKDIYFLLGKETAKKETSCFFTRVIYLVLQKRKFP